MKKFLTSAAFMFAFGSYALYQHFGNSTLTYNAQSIPTATSLHGAPIASNTGAPVSAAPQPVSQPTSVPTPTPAPPPAPAPKPKGQYIDGTYIGRSADAYYGYIQVQAIISGGKIADVKFLQYPNDRNTSRYINGQAMPILRSEAIQAQSASIDGVSGASDTSAAFQESLASALTQARS